MKRTSPDKRLDNRYAHRALAAKQARAARIESKKKDNRNATD